MIKERMESRPSMESTEGPKAGPVKEPAMSRDVADTAWSSRSPTSLWVCPDCGVEMNAPNEGDLGFVKREHIREYHPNRAPTSK